MNKEASTAAYTYGPDDDDVHEEVVDPALVEAAREATRGTPELNGDVVHISRKSCRCGSKEHERTSHSSCHVNLKN